MSQVSMTLAIFLVVLCSLTGVVTASSTFELPLTDVQTIIDFPSTTYGGSTNTVQYYVIFADKTPLLIRIDVEHPLIEDCGEWWVVCNIDGNPTVTKEVSPGVFESEPKIVETGAHSVQIMLTSVPNIYPDNYRFSVEFNYTPKKKDVSGHSGVYTSTRRYVSYTPPLTVITTEPVVMTPTSSQTELPIGDNHNKETSWVFFVLILVLAYILGMVWCLHTWLEASKT